MHRSHKLHTGVLAVLSQLLIHGELSHCRYLLTVDPVGAITTAKTSNR